MDKGHFDQLVKGVRQMKRHIAGRPVPGIRISKARSPTSAPLARRRNCRSRSSQS
jgi:hypothetical protein